jgi:methylphosphotriester-DNA--protein-cysteine methyltransferase
MAKLYRLHDRRNRPYDAPAKGRFGGHKRSKIYGRLDCPGALRWIAKGHYVRHRVFFQDEATARAAGYRPCAVCMPAAYRVWKAGKDADPRWP